VNFSNKFKYTRENGIAADPLRYWKAKVEAAPKPRDPFVPVRVQTTRFLPPLAANSFVIAVSDRVDPSWIAALTRNRGAKSVNRICKSQTWVVVSGSKLFHFCNE